MSNFEKGMLIAALLGAIMSAAIGILVLADCLLGHAGALEKCLGAWTVAWLITAIYFNGSDRSLEGLAFYGSPGFLPAACCVLPIAWIGIVCCQACQSKLQRQRKPHLTVAEEMT